jgi:hypothetical protein
MPYKEGCLIRFPKAALAGTPAYLLYPADRWQQRAGPVSQAGWPECARAIEIRTGQACDLEKGHSPDRIRFVLGHCFVCLLFRYIQIDPKTDKQRPHQFYKVSGSDCRRCAGSAPMTALYTN